MTEPVKLDASAMVATLLQGAPSLPWTLERKKSAGGKIVKESIPYRMQVLRAEEEILATKAAQDSAKAIGELPGYDDVYKMSMAHELLLRAVRHNEARDRNDGTSYYPPAYTDVSQLRASLTTLEMAALLNAYEVTKATFAVVDGLEGHSVESWIARFSDPLKGPFYISELDSLHWPGAIQLLATECRRLYELLGLPLPSSEPPSAFDPESLDNSTSSSGPPPSASNTGTEETVELLGDRQITKDEAAAIVARRKGRPGTE